MTSPRKPVNGQTEPNGGRRLVLTGILASYVSSFIPWSISKASAQSAAPTPATAPDAFLNVSRIITGRTTLDAAQANRLHAGLVATVPSFSTQLDALAAFITQNPASSLQLQSSLDAAKAPFAQLAPLIATAWYVGVVGSGSAARCVTYETSLMNVVVSDRLKPPSYAYGPYGSWGRNPSTAA
jgi:hypothetical protein